MRLTQRLELRQCRDDGSDDQRGGCLRASTVLQGVGLRRGIELERVAVPLRDLKGEIIGVGERSNKARSVHRRDASCLQTLRPTSQIDETTQLERQLQDYPLEKESDRRPDIVAASPHRNHGI